MENTAIMHYIGQLQKAMKGDLWVDESFDKKLNGIEEGFAFRRPLPDVHSIAEVLRGKDDAFLKQRAKDETHDLQYYVDGLLQHDMYHLGQIGLILKMLKTTAEQ